MPRPSSPQIHLFLSAAVIALRIHLTSLGPFAEEKLWPSGALGVNGTQSHHRPLSSRELQLTLQAKLIVHHPTLALPEPCLAPSSAKFKAVDLRPD